MNNSSFIENLLSFNLTRQEAIIYEALLQHGQMTGYEVAKQTGISRSNAYASLNALLEKGCAYLIEGEAATYTPVAVNQFVNNALSNLAEKGEYIIQNAPKKIEQSTGYLTIVGAQNIKNKITEMLNQTQLRLYIMAPAEILRPYANQLKELVANGKKVVILSNEFELDGAKVYEATPEPGQLRFITDSSYVLTGELTGSAQDTCLYSGQKNLVSVMKEALKNKIILLENK